MHDRKHGTAKTATTTITVMASLRVIAIVDSLMVFGLSTYEFWIIFSALSQTRQLSRHGIATVRGRF